MQSLGNNPDRSLGRKKERHCSSLAGWDLRRRVIRSIFLLCVCVKITLMSQATPLLTNKTFASVNSKGMVVDRGCDSRRESVILSTAEAPTATALYENGHKQANDVCFSGPCGSLMRVWSRGCVAAESSKHVKGHFPNFFFFYLITISHSLGYVLSVCLSMI